MTDCVFTPADILIPVCDDINKWSVIACDQFSSDKAYWEKVGETVGDSPSTLNIIFPEAYLDEWDAQDRIDGIRSVMEEYSRSGLFRKVENSSVYIERTRSRGKV